jgi:hypothetical protein
MENWDRPVRAVPLDPKGETLPSPPGGVYGPQTRTFLRTPRVRCGAVLWAWRTCCRVSEPRSVGFRQPTFGLVPAAAAAEALRNDLSQLCGCLDVWMERSSHIRSDVVGAEFEQWRRQR